MALSRKNQRKLEKLRTDADRLWAEQQVVLAKAGQLAARAGVAGREYANDEIVPPVRDAYRRNIRPTVNEALANGRKALCTATKTFNKCVLPAVVRFGSDVNNNVRKYVEENKALAEAQARAEEFGKEASDRFADLQGEVAQVADKARVLTVETTKKADKKAAKLSKRYAKLRKQEEAKKKGLGFGGWFLVGTAVAAAVAAGYALWQTFRADDDLWIADEELDAPVTNVEAPAAN